MSKSATSPSYDPKVSEGLQLAEPYDRKISEAPQVVPSDSRYSLNNNWYEAPQVIVREETPKYLCEDSTTSPITPRTPEAVHRSYPINRGSSEEQLTRLTTDLEKGLKKDTRKRKRKICGCTQPVFWLSLTVIVLIAIGASVAGGLVPLNIRNKSTTSSDSSPSL